MYTSGLILDYIHHELTIFKLAPYIWSINLPLIFVRRTKKVHQSRLTKYSGNFRVKSKGVNWRQTIYKENNSKFILIIMMMVTTIMTMTTATTTMITKNLFAATVGGIDSTTSSTIATTISSSSNNNDQ